jgi:hypothetical protein
MLQWCLEAMETLTTFRRERRSWGRGRGRRSCPAVGHGRGWRSFSASASSVFVYVMDSLRIETRGGCQEVRKGERERGVPRTVAETSDVTGISGYLAALLAGSSKKSCSSLVASEGEKGGDRWGAWGGFIADRCLEEGVGFRDGGDRVARAHPVSAWDTG